MTKNKKKLFAVSLAAVLLLIIGGVYIAAVFGFADLKDVRIIDTKSSRTYDGSGQRTKIVL